MTASGAPPSVETKYEFVQSIYTVDQDLSAAFGTPDNMVFAGADLILITPVFHVYHYTMHLYLLQEPFKKFWRLKSKLKD